MRERDIYIEREKKKKNKRKKKGEREMLTVILPSAGGKSD